MNNIEDLLSINGVLEALSGAVTILHEGKPTQVHFTFSGATRLAIADAQEAQEAILKPVKAAEKALIKQNGGPWALPCLEQKQCSEEIEAMREKEIEIPAFELPLAEFVKDSNPVPASFIKVLRPYLK